MRGEVAERVLLGVALLLLAVALVGGVRYLSQRLVSVFEGPVPVEAEAP